MNKPKEKNRGKRGFTHFYEQATIKANPTTMQACALA
jgi:hypothetical protein